MAYTFKSLDELANWLKELGNRSLTTSQSKKTIRDARFFEGKYAAYNDVANMLKDTHITGESK